MAIEVNPPLAGYAQGLFDQAAGRGQQAIDQVETDLVEFSRLLVHQVRLRKALADLAAFPAADRAGQLEPLEGELFFVATLIEQQPAVRSALTNPGLPVANKRALLADLLEGRVNRRAAPLAALP